MKVFIRRLFSPQWNFPKFFIYLTYPSGLKAIGRYLDRGHPASSPVYVILVHLCCLYFQFPCKVEKKDCQLWWLTFDRSRGSLCGTMWPGLAFLQRKQVGNLSTFIPSLPGNSLGKQKWEKISVIKGCKVRRCEGSRTEAQWETHCIPICMTAKQTTTTTRSHNWQWHSSPCLHCVNSVADVWIFILSWTVFWLLCSIFPRAARLQGDVFPRPSVGPPDWHWLPATGHQALEEDFKLLILIT